MARPKTKYFRCQNRSKCELAKRRQTIEISEGTRFNCPLSDPNCERTNLREIDRPNGGPPLFIIGGVVAIILITVVSLVFWLKGPTDDSVKALNVEAALKDIWPWLK